jgi:hypothetical protein
MPELRACNSSEWCRGRPLDRVCGAARAHTSFDAGRPPYTVDGIGAMFRRYCNKANVSDFGLRDLRAKGVTDMFRADANSIRKIQLLLLRIS